jgi:ribosomal protein S18 acetylase RimI-like enzyme
VRGEERILGMYKLQPNHVGRGAHVANASYMVSPNAQGVGVGHLLGEHSIGEARRKGYLAMQFNFVVSTNNPAIHLWKRLGFSIVGTLPKAYRHRRLGYVDAYVMYKLLEDPARWPLPDED